ncbi:MAG: PD40 domain-containing protein [Bdellovibrionales bacterium]|nr:PD40 domain-containing protein [Bdellovibrionales bacterium]
MILGAEGVGVIGLVGQMQMFGTTLSTFLLGNGLTQILSRARENADASAMKSSLATAFTVLLVLNGLFAAFLGVWMKPLAEAALGSRESFPFLIPLLVSVPVHSFLGTWVTALFFSHRRALDYTKASVAGAAVEVGLFVFLLRHYGIQGALWSVAIGLVAWLLVALWLIRRFYPFWEGLRLDVHRGRAGELFTSGVTMSLAGLFSYGTNAIIRSHFLQRIGPAESGVYHVAIVFTSLYMPFLTNALWSRLHPTMSARGFSEESRREWTEAVLFVAAFGSLVQVGITCFAPLLIPALYTRELHYSNLWLVSPEGTGEVPTVKTKQLTTGTSWIEFQKISPDGKRVAFSMGQHPHSNIFVMPIEGGAMQQLTFLDAFNTGVAWSPNGQEIVFDSDQGGKFKVWRINSNGGTPRPFEKSEASYDAPALSWSPGFHVLYQQVGNRNFNLIHPQTEEERPLVANDSVGWMFFPRYSPDGKSVAVYWNRRKQHGAYGLWLVSLADSSQALLSKGTLIPIEWSADGKWIYAWDYRKKPKEVLRISAKGGEPKPFAVLPFENITFGESISMTTDGKHLICVVNETRSDVWLMENFAPE